MSGLVCEAVDGPAAVAVKLCRKCGTVKPLDSFARRADIGNGLQTQCRACKAAWREANKERKAATDKAWREANKERRAAASKAWRDANKERAAAASKAWDEANKERRAAASKAWRDANKERKATASKAYYAANKERADVTNKVWRAANKEHVAAVKAAYAAANRVRVVAAKKAWAEANPERHAANNRAKSQRRRARKRDLACDSSITFADIVFMWGSDCYLCGRPTDSGAPVNSMNKADIEHVIPVAKKGAWTLGNLRIACHGCNMFKGAHRTAEEVQDFWRTMLS